MTDGGQHYGKHSVRRSGIHRAEHEVEPDIQRSTEVQREMLAPSAGSRRGRLRLTLAGAVLVAAVAGTTIVSSAPAATPSRPAGTTRHMAGQAALAGHMDSMVAPLAVGAVELASLPHATTFGTVPNAPHDTDGRQSPSGQVVHPSRTVPVYLAPGGAAIAALPTQQLGSDTWLPVIAQQPGWAQVMLPVRPNGSTGWIYLNDTSINMAITPYRIVVDRATFTLTLLDNNRQVDRWTVGVGLPQSVTPLGRTFILASITDPTQTFSPIILPLGMHSDSYTSYSGGPGTIGIHTWPSQNVYGEQSSHGCIRVPPAALGVLSTQVPMGTPVLIS